MKGNIVNNKHKLIYELKNYLYETKETPLEMMSLQASKVLAYIYSENILKQEYETQIKEYKDLEQNEQFQMARNGFLNFLNAICNDTLDKEDIKTIICSNFATYIDFMLKRLPINEKTNFLNNINRDTFSIIDICITLALAFKNKNITLSSENKRRLEIFEQYENSLAFYQLDQSITYCLFPTSKLFTANGLLLRASIKLVLTFLILFLENDKNLKLPQITDPKSLNCPLTEEEIQILKLRKDLSDNTYRNIGQNLTPKLTVGNITQKFSTIKNKLGVNSPDNAVNKFEENYYTL